jgi:hypothetical protein
MRRLAAAAECRSSRRERIDSFLSSRKVNSNREIFEIIAKDYIKERHIW